MQTIERATHEIDATGKAPGRLATEIATMLIGKNKPSYTPNVDSGDFVKVVNASKLAVTEKKMEQKKYYHHTRYAKGLREVSMKTLFAKNPSEVLRRSVSRMLPKNKLRDGRMKRLTIEN